MYMRKHPMLPPPRKKRGLFGFGDFTDSEQAALLARRWEHGVLAHVHGHLFFFPNM